MATYGLLIDYEYCTNCGSCIVSCKEEHGYPVGKDGIKVFEDGPWKVDEEFYNLNYFPLPTDLCDLCAGRTATGREPLCVHHCLSNIIYYGTVQELAKKLEEKPKQLLIVPQFKPMTSKPPFVSRGKHHKAAHAEVTGATDKAFEMKRHARPGSEDDLEQKKQDK